MANILVVDDETKMTFLVESALTDAGFSATSTNDPQKALELMDKHSFDIIVTDLSMPDISGIDILQESREKGDSDVVIMTAFGTVESAVSAMKQGAADYIVKPFPMDELVIVCKRILREQRLSGLNRTLTSDIRSIALDNFIGESRPAKDMLEMISKVAITETTVLLTGKSGTGKELAANLVHENSARSDKPFIAVNCAALVETLLESELFGHEKGSFTGADKRKLGRFELAEGGTIFLDEIAEMSFNLQAKLLRVLEERQFVRVGGVDNVSVDVRVVAATNKNLKDEIKKGSFREDLYFRLNVFPINVPTLYERAADIPLLAEYFLKSKNYSENKLSDEVCQHLQSYNWPGNIRELKNILERAMILAAGGEIEIEHIGIEDETERAPIVSSGGNPVGLETAEKEMILNALKNANGNKTEAAKLLKITRRRLYSRMKYHEI